MEPMSTDIDLDAMQTGAQTANPLVMLISLAVVIFCIAAVWKMFSKAGKPGWAAIIPIYNAVVLMQISGKPGWWVLLLLIPGVNIVILILAMISLAENFGKGGGFAAGLILLPIVFYAILAFGSAEYQPAEVAA